MPRATVLIGFAEALAAPEAAWSLLDRDFRVVAFARRGRASALRHSKYVKCYEISPPESDLKAALADIRDLCSSLSAENGSTPRLLFPLDDKAVWLGSRMELRDGWVLAGPRGPSAELALRKCIQIQAALDAGFEVPATGMARSAKDIFEFCETTPFPVILKAADCVSISGNRMFDCPKWICANRGELDRAVAAWGERTPVLVQPFIVGTGEGVFGFAGPDEVLGWSGHRRLRMMNPQGSGSSACVSKSVPPEIRLKAAEMVKRAGWRGMFMIELLRDAGGRVWFVELNGRPWGSLALSRRQGLEYAAWHIELAINPQASTATELPSDHQIVCRNLGREIMHLLFVLRGPKSGALVEWPSFWKTLADVLPIRRTDTFYNWCGGDVRVFLADCYYTIHDQVFKTKH